MWIAPETRDPVLLHHATRQSVGYFGAVCLREGRFLHRRKEDQFKAVSFWAFGQDLWGHSQSAGRQVVVITDNARYHPARLHKEWRQEHEGQFRLDFLPPYSPELNPVQKVWKLTRCQCLHNRYFPTLEEVTRTVESKFAEWASGNPTLTRLCAIT
jgi:hypothetical protein